MCYRFKKEYIDYSLRLKKNCMTQTKTQLKVNIELL